MPTETVVPETLPVLAPEDRPSVDHLVTEDGKPVDSIFSEKQMRLLTSPLYSSWAGPDGNKRFVALANVGLFASVNQPPFVPDMLLSLDVELPTDLFPKSHRSYFVWEYGKFPEVVVEVVSNREGGEDTTKLAGYARLRILYYVIFDPEGWLNGPELRVLQLRGRTYEPLAEPYWLPEVGLGLRLWHGPFEGHSDTWLRWCDAEGQVIPTGAERADLAEQLAAQAQEQAEAERQRAAAALQQAEAERQRAERLAAQLRALGVEPET